MAAPDETRQKVRWRLLDVDLVNPLIVDASTLDESIAMATHRYSQDRPREVVEDETGAGSPYFVVVGAGAVLASWVDGYSSVQRIDYPAAAISSSYTPTPLDPGRDWAYERDASKTYLRLTSAVPTASETVRITYTAPHTHTSVTDTVPANDLDALCDLAAYYACLQLGTKAAGSSDPTIGADSVNYRDSQLRYKQQAELWLTSYADHLGQSDDGKPAGASSWANWDSRNIAVGRPWLTHPSRRR